MPSTEVLGTIGETRAVEFFLRHGWLVDAPVLSGSPYDLHIHKGDRKFFVQCKYRTVNRGVVEIKNKRIRGKGKDKTFQYDLDKIQVFTIFVPVKDVLLVIPSSRIKCSLRIRLTKSKNGQVELTNSADEFINPKWICE